MSLELAQRLTEILLAFAFLQQCAEHMSGPNAARAMFLTRAVLCLALLTGFYSDWSLLALSIHSIAVLHRYNGPYNGGSDRMGLLILYCLTLSHWLPEGPLVQTAFAYLGVQVILSYFISGWVKILNPAWRSGAALRDVLAFLPIPWQKTCAPLPPIPAPCGPHRGPSSGSRFCSPSPCSTRRC